MAISLDKINSALDRLDNKGGSNNNQDNIVSWKKENISFVLLRIRKI